MMNNLKHDNSPFLRNLRVQYELGRLRSALPWIVLTAVFALGAYLSKRQWEVVVIASVLAVAVLLMRWVGKGWQHVARIGLGFGLIPYATMFASSLTRDHCATDGCSTSCAILCSAAGGVTGWFAVKSYMKHQLGWGRLSSPPPSSSRWACLCAAVLG